MSIFNSLRISASGLTAERLRLDVIADNLANVNTTRTAAGGPYRRKVAILEERPTGFADLLGTRVAPVVGRGGVRVAAIAEDASPPQRVYNPGHPDADAEGYVLTPNVNVVTEMVDMITATRAYEANVTAMNAAKQMALRTLDIGRNA
ncbi:MAG: flagellar basal body rod protein FlgC [Armatimonadota bacterium]|nr:flagellar basal body rod protein FlgC [bacterium]MDW8320962.1 flagellar basal body rod protein FlgC [Armatimonadota bacterium]